MNLADPELELIDPTPNVHLLFIHFDKQFFWTKLASRAVVRWSKRMYSCAGICSYEGRGGLCDIALSEPLLKLRPRKDLVETLLHEMIHAFLFVTCRDQDRDGHGPNFKSHMYRINKFAGLNISIYHDFHDEVKLYQTHWWRCNGPCQTRKPYFGIVRRTCNRAPGKNDCWWQDHQSKCGGTFIKIKEPTPTKKSAKSQAAKAKNNADITKYINNNHNTINNNATDKNFKKPVLKDNSNVPVKNVATKSNSSSTVVVTKKGNVVFNPKASQPIITPIPFSGYGQTISGDRKRSNSVDVIDTVRNVWANKKLTSTVNSVVNSTVLSKSNKPPSRLSSPITPKHKIESPTNSPPMKIKKIDDYFKNTASSILKDVYGEDFKITESDDKKLKAVNTKALVDCPVCSAKVDRGDINKHLDECLNKEVLEQLSQSNHEPEDIKPNHNLTNIKNTNTLPEIDNSNIGLTKPILSPGSKPKLSDFIDLRFVTTERMPMQMPKKEPVDCDFKFNKIDLTNKVSAADLKTAADIKVEPGCSKDSDAIEIKEVMTDDIKVKLKVCPCCAKEFDQPVEVHLEECLGMFDNDTTIPEEGASTSYLADTILIDDDDIFDETLTLNATGTKSPCPCCLKMIEAAQMNDHLDECLK